MATGFVGDLLVHSDVEVVATLIGQVDANRNAWAVFANSAKM